MEQATLNFIAKNFKPEVNESRQADGSSIKTTLYSWISTGSYNIHLWDDLDALNDEITAKGIFDSASKATWLVADEKTSICNFSEHKLEARKAIRVYPYPLAKAQRLHIYLAEEATKRAEQAEQDRLMGKAPKARDYTQTTVSAAAIKNGVAA